MSGYITVTTDSNTDSPDGGSDSSSSTATSTTSTGSVSRIRTEKMKGEVYDYSVVMQKNIANGFETTLVSKKGKVTITPLKADVVMMPEAISSWSAEIVNDPEGGGKISTGVVTIIPDTVVASYRSTLSSMGYNLSSVAYAMNVLKDERIGITRDAVITMTAPLEWVRSNGGEDRVMILRISDEGIAELLDTTFSGYDHDSGYLTFRAESPDGLCTFTLMTVQPVPSVAGAEPVLQAQAPGITPGSPDSIPSSSFQPIGETSLPPLSLAVIVILVILGATAGFFFIRRQTRQNR
jgi:hypothetical protein